MSSLDELLERNRRFAGTDAKDHVPLPVLPNCQAYVITCLDPRVEPGAVLGIGLGDALVARCAGGRVTDDVKRDLAWICNLHQLLAPEGDWFEVVVMHHSECGAALLADDSIRADFASRVGASEAELARLAVVDPSRTVAEDVEALLESPGLSPKVAVSGWTYDVRSGEVAQVVRPRYRSAADPAATSR